MLADRHRSRAVLIGASRYSMLDALPAVAANVRSLGAALEDPDLWGLPAEHCRQIIDPVDSAAVDGPLRAVAGQASDLLVLYVAGHGLVDESGELHLATVHTEPDAVHSTAVPYEWIRRAVLRSPARQRLVILDCCYAGRAAEVMAGLASISDDTLIEDTCVIAATSASSVALSVPDERHTAFTGRLLAAIGDGVDGGPAFLTVHDLWRQVASELGTAGRPVPSLRARDDGNRIVLVRNRRAAPADAVPPGLPAQPQRGPMRTASHVRKAWPALGIGLIPGVVGVLVNQPVYILIGLVISVGLFVSASNASLHRYLLVYETGQRPATETGAEYLWHLRERGRVTVKLRPNGASGGADPRLGGELSIVVGDGGEQVPTVQYRIAVGGTVVATGTLAPGRRTEYLVPHLGRRFYRDDGRCARLEDITSPESADSLVELAAWRSDRGRGAVNLRWSQPSLVVRGGSGLGLLTPPAGPAQAERRYRERAPGP